MLTVSKYVQHIFPGGAKYFLGRLRPPWLRACLQRIYHEIDTQLIFLNFKPERGN